MKVKANKIGGLAIDPRTIVYFVEGEELEAGVKGLSDENIQRLIELNFADIIGDSDATEEESVVVEESEIEKEIPEKYDFESFTDKTELVEYAKEIYNVALDGRKSLEKLILDLKAAIEAPVAENKETE